ncbi:MAG: T9SS type A sorting domain-containing protein [Bacteroidia bacterium]
METTLTQLNTTQRLLKALSKETRLLKALILLSFFFNGVIIPAQAPSKFFTRFGGNGHDVGYGVKQTLDGQYIVTGSTSSFGQGNTDVYLAKVDSMGWVRWEKAYGGFNNDIGRQVVQLADSGYVIAGYTNSQGNGGYDVYLVRTDKNGTLIWQKTFGGMDWDFAYDLRQTADNGYLICGSTMSSGRGGNDGYIIKTDANGVLQWSKTYGGSGDDEFRSMVLTYNNLYAFAGTTKSYGDVNGDCWLFKTDLNGDSVLHAKYGSNKMQFINDIAENPNNHNFILCGGNDYDGTDSTYSYILVLNENGSFNSDNQFSYHHMQYEQFVSVAYLESINFCYLRKQYNVSQNAKLEPMIMINTPLYDIPGGVTTYGSFDDDELFDVYRTRDKGFVAVGYTYGFGASLTDVFLVKIDSNYSTIGNAPNIDGIDEVKAATSSLIVYPTLTKDIVNVISNNTTGHPEKVNIHDMFGRQIYACNYTENLKLDFSKLTEGIYFVSVTIENAEKVFKIIKTN